MTWWKKPIVLAMVAVSTQTLEAGPFSAHSKDPTNAHDPPLRAWRMRAWATAAVNYAPAPGVLANRDPNAALGAPDGASTVSLGDLFSQSSPPPTDSTIPFGPPDPFSGDLNDPDDDYGFIGIDPAGSITLGFAMPIVNGSGADFAVFENALDNLFSGDGTFVYGEFAYVEVSTNGVDFARFASIATNTEASLDDTFGRDFAAMDPTNVHNLAGKHLGRWGTPFDLELLAGDPAVQSGVVDLGDIEFVRLVDVPGNGSFLDALNNPIYDSWETVGTGGLDLDAVGVLNQVPQPAAGVLACAGALMWLGRRTTQRC